MTRRRIPTPAQVRAVPVTSVRAMRDGLESVGLTVSQGKTHLRVTTGRGVLVGALPLTPSDPRSLLNCRSWIAKRCAQIADSSPRRKP